MRSPKSLETLADQGIIEEVLRPLMSGKEAQIYMVVSDGRVCAAKIYKESQNRSFKNRADYTEGRKVRNSRDQRAMDKGSKYGKSKDEDAWRTTEVDMIYRLRAAGVRVPEPYMFMDGVLLMELVCDRQGNPAPRLGDVSFTPREATEIFHLLLQEVVRMLCAGVVHGDLSDFNVLLSHDGPVVIDFPQSIEASGNLNARRLFLRDVDNLHRFLARYVPGARRKPYGEEIWSLWENNQLTPGTQLSGTFKSAAGPVDTSAVLALIGDANRDEMRRRETHGHPRPRGETPTAPGAGPALMRRREVIIEKPAARGGRPPHRGPGPGHGQGGPHHGHSSHGNGAHGHGGHERSGQGHGGAGHSHGPGHSHRGPARAEGGRPFPPKRPTTTPKRGDSVQNSVYVSPEARKAKVKPLTPRSSSAADLAPQQAKNGDAQHRRGPRGPNTGTNGQRPAGGPQRGGGGGGGQQHRQGNSQNGAGQHPRSNGGHQAQGGGQQHRQSSSQNGAGQARPAAQGAPQGNGSSDSPTGARRARNRARREERMNTKEPTGQSPSLGGPEGSRRRRP